MGLSVSNKQKVRQAIVKISKGGEMATTPPLLTRYVSRNGLTIGGLKFLIIRKIARGTLCNYGDRGPTLGFSLEHYSYIEWKQHFIFDALELTQNIILMASEQKIKELRPRMNRTFKTQGWTRHTNRQGSVELGIAERPKKILSS